jgi:undecaprenyl-diphosphatase
MVRADSVGTAMGAQRARTVAQHPVIAPARRRLAGAIALGCLVVVLALAVVVRGRDSGTTLDNKIDPAVIRHLSTSVSTALLHLTDPVVIACATAALAALAAARRRWRLFAVTLLSPSLALLLTEVVLKPVVHRTHEGALAYPSGHESVPASLATILALLVLQTRWRVRVKAAALAALVLYLVLCAVALVGVFFHYATDTVGAVCLSVTCVLATALVVDRQFT